MARTSKTAERVKDGVGDLVKKARAVVNDGLDSAKETFDDRVDRLDRQYRETAAQVRGNAERVSKKAYKRVADVRKSLLGRYTRARKKVSRLQRDTGKYVRDNPGKSLLAATGLGLLVGLVTSPRRRLAAQES
jgi:ElaB/YqjD/DUF883 family membrane-anchored ribosome-binding protein